MNLEDIPLFSMMKSRMGYVSERERLISQNVANADTPGFVPKDLKPFTLSGAGADTGSEGRLAMTQPSGSGAAVGGGAQGGMVMPVRTDPAHLGFNTSDGGSATWKSTDSADSEAKIDGNQVVVEDQMSKLTASRMDYQAVIGFYEKAIDMLKMAGTAPGK